MDNREILARLKAIGDKAGCEIVSREYNSRLHNGVRDLIAELESAEGARPEPEPADRPIDLGETVYHWDVAGRLRRGVVKEIHATQDGKFLAADLGNLTFNTGERIVAPASAFTRNPFPKD